MGIKSNPKISILTGAGASRALGYPLADDIRFCLFEDNDLCKHTDGTFLLTKEKGFHSETSKKSILEIRKTLRAVRVLCDSYSGRSETNYEDWYYIMDQIHRAVSGDLDNLMTKPFIEKLAEFISQGILLKEMTSFTMSYSAEVGRRCENACKMISDIVAHSLFKRPDGEFQEKLPWLKGVLNDEEITLEAIMTLNQDSVLESFLDKLSIQWTDGFATSSDRLRDCFRWNADSFNGKILPLLKLHGSTNWYSVDEVIDSREQDKRTLKEIHYLKSDQIRILPNNFTPHSLMLVGRHNKALSYSAPLFNELHTLAGRALNRSDVLIVIGYSAMDKFINRMIINWLYSGGEKRLVVVTPSLFELMQSSRHAFAKSMAEWEDREDVKCIESFSEELSWDRLKQSLV
jgi:hypothetical protein